MKKIFLFTLLCLGFCLPTLAQQDYGFEVKPGTIIRKNRVNKIGAPVSGVYDFYFRTGDAEYFIKLSESKVDGKTLEKYIDKPVTLSYRITDGDWDNQSGDLEHRVQSRMGTYIVVLGMEEKH